MSMFNGAKKGCVQTSSVGSSGRGRHDEDLHRINNKVSLICSYYSIMGDLGRCVLSQPRKRR